jgi:hypothetical protein
MITWRGETLALWAWAARTGLPYPALQVRLDRGWSIDDALTRPLRKLKRLIEFNGERLTLRQWAQKTGIPYRTLVVRMRANRWDISRALNASKYGRLVEYDGRSMTIPEWGDFLGIRAMTLVMRLHRGWSIGRTLGTPVGGK